MLAGKGRPKVFVQVESHEARDASAPNAGVTDVSSPDARGEDDFPGSQAMAALAMSDVPKSVKQSQSSQV